MCLSHACLAFFGNSPFYLLKDSERTNIFFFLTASQCRVATSVALAGSCGMSQLFLASSLSQSVLRLELSKVESFTSFQSSSFAPSYSCYSSFWSSSVFTRNTVASRLSMLLPWLIVPLACFNRQGHSHLSTRQAQEVSKEAMLLRGRVWLLVASQTQAGSHTSSQESMSKSGCNSGHPLSIPCAENQRIVVVQ